MMIPLDVSSDERKDFCPNACFVCTKQVGGCLMWEPVRPYCWDGFSVLSEKL